MRLIFVVMALTLLVLGRGMSAGTSSQIAGIEFFEKKIRPVLVEHCYSCHSTGAKKLRGGLLLDSRDGIRTGGDTGPAVVPGKPGESLLLKALHYTDEGLKMPPKGKLPQAVIADFEAWVKMGAPDPRDKAASSKATLTWEEMLKDRRQWWSLQPVRNPVVPTVKNTGWSDDPVDRFLLAKLEEKGLTPAPPADPVTLIRRLSLVLTGLPPTLEEIADFQNKPASPANKSAIANLQSKIERLVDRLLASPHFGERWARHWMDVVRFSETHGNEWNYEVHHAWRYRDYLIRAFNDDVPYDQFVREHIAGDLLPKPRWNHTPPSPPLLRGGTQKLSPPLEKGGAGGVNESIIGTAFYRFGEVNHDDCIDLPSIGYDLLDNQIDTLSKAFQATTVACARCHDHKLDAVSMKDYYGLLGILRGSRQVSHTIDAPQVNAEVMTRLQALKQQIRTELGKVWLEQLEGLRNADLGFWTGLPRSEIASPKWEDPLEPWRILAAQDEKKSATFQAEWRGLAQKFAEHSRSWAKNHEQYTAFADFAVGGFAGWQAGGQGLRAGPVKSGDCVIALEGKSVLRAILPKGVFTHSLSDRLNGTLRSPILSTGKKYISFQVVGEKQSAVRLVSNGCQLNYRNYRALTKDKLHWVTLPIPADAAGLRVYAELMTKFDNPKFPDQLGTLGGDTVNHRVPWEQAAADPHSYFGVTRVVLHDEAPPPKDDLSYLEPLFAGREPRSLAELGQRYREVTAAAVQRWLQDRADDNDAHWLDGLLRQGVLENKPQGTSALAKLVNEYRRVEATLAQPQIIPGLADFGPGCAQPIFVRGDCLKPGEIAPRRYLEVLSSPEDQFAGSGSGRLELAERIASPANPLTARVMVNRIWHHLFGAGLVRTVDDFGKVGDAPSHPELLDYLAARFVEEGWSIKRLIRALVLTKAFQMSHVPNPVARETDPHNRLLHHYPARRLEAEGIRDAILAASGRLDRTLFGPSIAWFRAKENADRRLFPGPLDGLGRRSIYIKNTLMEAPHFLGVFDFPGGKVPQGRRDVTNVPAQALALLNDPFVLQQAELWAKKVVARQDATAAVRIDHMFQTALSRPPTAKELQRFAAAAGRFAELHRVPAEEMLTSQGVWKDLAHAIFNLKEFIYIP